jgi:hypothetical protein
MCAAVTVSSDEEVPLSRRYSHALTQKLPHAAAYPLALQHNCGVHEHAHASYAYQRRRAGGAAALVVLVQPEATAVWAGLPIGKAEEDRTLARRKTARSAAPPPTTGAAPKMYGMRWVQRQLAVVAEILAALHAGEDISGMWRRGRGALMLAQHFVRLWDGDLRARLEVRPPCSLRPCGHTYRR